MECYSYSLKSQPAWAGAEKAKVNPVPFIPFWATASIQGQLQEQEAVPGPDHSPPTEEPGSPGGGMQPMPAHYQHALHQGMVVAQEHYGLPPITTANNSLFSGAVLRPQQYMVAAPAAHAAPAVELAAVAEAMPGQGEDLTARMEVQAHKSQPSSEPVGSKGREIYTEDEDGVEVVYRGSAEHLERHGRGEKVDRVYDCDGCDKAFTREEHMKRHAKQHTDEPEHRCDIPDGTTGRICDKKFTRRERLTRHIKVVHLGEVPERPFWCNHCGKDFQRKEHLERHERNIHGPGGSAEIEESDEMDEMGGSPGLEEGQRPAPLPVATRQLPLPRVRQERMDSLDDSGSNSAGTLHCTYSDCTKSFSKKQSLERHVKQHMGIEPDRPYSCSDCWKTFTRKEHMLRHQRGHTGETPFSCTEPGCAKKFNRKEHLKRHLLIHSGEHPYPCSECGRSFGRTERLRKHMKSHGIEMLDPSPQAKPKSEPVLKKEPIFTQESNSSQGVFGSQTSELLKMMKGPLSPEQHLAHRQAQAQAYAQAQVLAKLPSFSTAATLPTKQTTTAADTLPVSQPAVTSSSPMMAAVPSVAAELSKLPSAVSYFAVAGQGGMPTEHVSNGFYQAAAPAGYVTTTMAGRPGELATLPINWPVNWQMAHMQPAGMVNLRSPGKADGTETAYASFRPSFS